MEDTTENKLARLRKLWVYAKSHGKDSWADQIVKDANKLKETPPDDYEVMKGLVETTIEK